MFTEEELQALQERNQQRVKQAIEKMGNKWLCHPENSVKKLKKQRKLRK
jgi:mRNA-degrading endonuclease RelE of RelBE toxin-antitoxin system